MKKMSMIECTEVMGGISGVSNDTPLTPEQKLGLFMFIGALFAAGVGSTFSSGSITARVGSTTVGLSFYI